MCDRDGWDAEGESILAGNESRIMQLCHEAGPYQQANHVCCARKNRQRRPTI